MFTCAGVSINTAVAQLRFLVKKKGSPSLAISLFLSRDSFVPIFLTCGFLELRQMKGSLRKL